MKRMFSRRAKGALLWWLMILLLLVAAGCSDDESVSSKTETYSGTYSVQYPATMYEKTDSVVLRITGASYEVDHYRVQPNAEQYFCSSEGAVTGFGTNATTFSPTAWSGSNCDTLRLPSGLYEADWRTHGDTVWLDRNSNDTLFQFRLLP